MSEIRCLDIFGNEYMFDEGTYSDRVFVVCLTKLQSMYYCGVSLLLVEKRSIPNDTALHRCWTHSDRARNSYP
jgi:hypothetical protein